MAHPKQAFRIAEAARTALRSQAGYTSTSRQRYARSRNSVAASSFSSSAQCSTCHGVSPTCLHASTSRQTLAARPIRPFHSTAAQRAQPLPSRIDEDWEEYDYGPSMAEVPPPSSSPSRQRQAAPEHVKPAETRTQRSPGRYEPFRPPPAPPTSRDRDDRQADRLDPPRGDPKPDQWAAYREAPNRNVGIIPTPQVEPGFPPPIQPAEMIEDDKARYDWRARAPSRDTKKRSKWSYSWFPDHRVRRNNPDMAKLSPGEPYFDEVTNYLAHFQPLLQAEQDEAVRQHQQRQLEWADERSRREGVMLDELVGSLFKTGTQGMTYTFSYGGKRATERLAFHSFVPGTVVELSRTHPLTDPVLDNGKIMGRGGEGPLLRGYVTSVGKGNIRVGFHGFVHQVEEGEWRLDLGCDDFAFRRQTRALTSLQLDPLAQELLDTSRSAMADAAPAVSEPEDFFDAPPSKGKGKRQPLPEQTKLHGTHLRDKLLRVFQQQYMPRKVDDSAGLGRGAASTTPAVHGMQEPPTLTPEDLDAVPIPSQPEPELRGETVLSRNQMINSWTQRYRTQGTPLRIEGDPDIRLNPSQMRAIAMMLSERLSLVQGPPGTGKTRVIIETIKLLKKHWQIPHPILVTAHTNAAVDNLVAGMTQHGLKALRFGPPERIREDLIEHGFEAACKRHPISGDIQNLKEQQDAVWAKLKVTTTPAVEATLQKRANFLKGQIFHRTMVMGREVLLDADVICTTCLSATSRMLDEIDFPIVFLDEASMATEPLSLIPLTKGSAHVAIIGDHKQLPPVIISPEAHAGGLAVSLFERLIHEHHVPSIMLDTQYRMHPLISSFPSATFYNSLLADGTVDSTGDAHPRFDPPNTAFLLPDPAGRRMNVSFVDHDYPESPTSKSIANWGDAEKVCDVIADLLECNPDLKGKDIGVITPYTAQIRLIKNYLLTDETRAEAFVNVLGRERAAELEDIEVKTVDGFEGREKEVIVFSTVRSNAYGYIGFLADWRRINVGLTRAKRGLILIGSASTLEKSRSTKALRESFPPGGEQVWRDYIAWLRKRDLIIRA